MAKSIGYGAFMIQSLVIHLIFLYSIFDIYFTSPLLHGMGQHEPKLSKLPADRLVLYIADGLRADKCFEDTAMPFIREKAMNDGLWRVSHTRVPTESRPGHVAIIGGFYEDVSAVAKGWQENPVEFDSVFNQSHKTWAFGSPDIINIFTKGNTKNNIISFTYPSEVHNFASSDLTAQDTWCFDKVEEFFQGVRENVTLNQDLHNPKTVFFVYLPGIDTNGHRYNPSSKETRENVQLVDTGIHRITKLIDEYYGDNRTAYLMTSDHGMTEWGTHGSGLTHETLTPMVAWGAGVKHEFTEKMSMSNAKNILQADIAPFMSSLLSLNFPVNNVGLLHTDLLSVDWGDKSQLMLTNTLQVVEQFLISLQNKQKMTLSWLFRPYSPLSASDALSRIRDIKLLIKSEEYKKAITECQTLIEKALDGVTYYHKYDRLFLGFCITTGFIGWMLYTLVFIIEHFIQNTGQVIDNSSRHTNLLWWLLRGAIFFAAYAQGLPWMHIVYCLVPTGPLQFIVTKWHFLLTFICERLRDKDLSTNLILIAILVAGLEIIVHSFFHRELLSLAMVVLAVTDYERYDWLISCLILMVFPMLPVVGRGANYYLVISCGITGVILLSLIKNKSGINIFQIFLLICANLDVVYTSYSINVGDGLPLVSQIVSWLILALTWILPMAERTNLSFRMITANTALFTLYILMSTSYESWFLLSLSIFLYCWIKKETASSDLPIASKDDFLQSGVEEHSLSLDDIRKSFTYLLLITVGFFGTGNIASLNSFEPASMFCFITAYSPFSMAALLLLKVIIPFIVIACTFHVITSQTGMKRDGVFLIILLMSDLMGMHFFMWVQDYGSWLDIGTSISHYVITLTTTLVLIILSKFSQFIMTSKVLPSRYELNNKLA